MNMHLQCLINILSIKQGVLAPIFYQLAFAGDNPFKGVLYFFKLGVKEGIKHLLVVGSVTQKASNALVSKNAARKDIVSQGHVNTKECFSF